MNNVVGQAVDEFASANKNMHMSTSGASYTTHSTTGSKALSNLLMGSELRSQNNNILNILQKAEESKKHRTGLQPIVLNAKTLPKMGQGLKP